MIARVRSRHAPRTRQHRLKFHSHKVRLTAEGWYYLLVIAFIIGGAVLREVNLLVLLGGMMIGPFLWNWLLARWALQGVTATEVPVPRVHAGEPLSVAWLIHHDAARLPAWGVQLAEAIERPGQRGRARAHVAIPVLTAQQATRCGYKLTVPDRGAYQIGPMRLSTSFPLGLIRTSAMFPRRRTVLVWPKLGRLTPDWYRLLKRAQIGQQTTQPRKGRAEGDYYGLREWRPGDSRRWIHWRTSARTNQLTVKQFEQRREESLSLVVDLWLPEEPQDRHREAVERAIRFAATIVEDRRKRGEHEVRMVLQGVERHEWRGVIKGPLAARILDALACIEGATWDAESGAESLWSGLDVRRQQVLVISTRERPPVATAESADVCWIGPDQYERWFVGGDAESSSDQGSLRPVPRSAEAAP